jgi:hypothetical protein
MGTRNLTKVVDANGVTKVAQYGQWDGYPSGQGLTALYHAHNAKMIEANLDKVHFITDEEADQINASINPDLDFGLQYPTLTRDTAADILGYVAFATQPIQLVDNSDFENDDLMCEGVYEINFQTREFISTFGKTVKFNLDDLPTKETYLESFAKDLTNA